MWFDRICARGRMLKALDERKTMNLVTVAAGGLGPVRRMERVILHRQNRMIGIPIYASIVVPGGWSFNGAISRGLPD